jgi:hypothetical protein
LVWNSHKSQPRIQQPICRTNHVVQQFSCLLLDNGTLASLFPITSGGHTSIGIDWHPFGVLEVDDYRQNNRLRFGDKLIFVNYIYMNKNEFK